MKPTENNTFEYRILRSKRKTLSITVSPEKGIVVSAPYWISTRQIEQFVNEKSEWILKKTGMIEKLQLRLRERELKAGVVMLYLGKEYNIQVLNGKSAVYFDGESVTIAVKAGLDTEEQKQRVRETLGKWYREKASDIIRERVELYSLKLKVKPERVLIKEQKTRWGSCSSKGNINLNWRLVMAPLDIIDYVVVHELVHLKHMNHKEEFWSAVEAVLPDYRDKRRWLKQNNWDLRF